MGLLLPLFFFRCKFLDCFLSFLRGALIGLRPLTFQIRVVGSESRGGPTFDIDFVSDRDGF